MTEEKLPELPERPAKFSNLPASPYAPLFVEKLLLAIIEANRDADSVFRASRKADLPGMRLKKAMTALFGRAGKTDPINDLPALVAAAQRHLPEESQRQYEILMMGKKPGQTTTPFSKMIEAQGHTQTDSPDRTRYARLQKKSKQVRYLKYLYQVTNETVNEEETAIFKDLQLIAKILARWNVDLNIDVDKLGMHSLSHSWSSV